MFRITPSIVKIIRLKTECQLLVSMTEATIPTKRAYFGINSVAASTTGPSRKHDKFDSAAVAIITESQPGGFSVRTGA